MQGNLELLSIVSVAVLSSFSHCYAMCGGLNLAFLQAQKNSKSPFFLSLIYHSFRILCYVFLGGIFGLFGKILAFNALSSGILLFVLGLFMVLLGTLLLLGSKLISLFEFSALFRFLTRILSKIKPKGVKAAVLFGFANGFMPCGLVYFFLASAMSRNDTKEAMLIMLIFGLSTLPAMLFLSKAHEFLRNKQIYSILSYLIIIAYGLYLSFTGFMLTR